MPRFTISHHTEAKDGDHYDLMLERGEVLATWRLEHTVFQKPQPAVRIGDHRKDYLDYEGEVSDGRGRVTLWDTGDYTVEEWSGTLVRIALRGKRFKVRLRLALPRTGTPQRWTVEDPSLGIRRAASTLLRCKQLDSAPTPELDALREELAAEELRLLAQVDRFVRGDEVEWKFVETNVELHRRVDREKLCWQHPWLAAAKQCADRLLNLADELLSQRPVTPA